MAKKLWDGTDGGGAGDYSLAANWVPSGVPAAADDVVFENSSQSVTAGFNQSAILLTTFKQYQSFTGSIGNPDDYLQIKCPIVHLGINPGIGSPVGSPLIKLDTGSVTAAQIRIHNTGTPAAADASRGAVQLLAAHASTDVHIIKGTIGIAVESSTETATVGDITVDYASNVSTDAKVVIGAGVTMTNHVQNGGQVANHSAQAITAVTVTAGTYNEETTGAVTTMTFTGGTGVLNGTATITTLKPGGGTMDLTRCSGRTITNVDPMTGGTIKSTDKITYTNGLKPSGNVSVTVQAA